MESIDMTELTDEQKQAFSFALKDMKNGHYHTLWVQRLRNEKPELYEHIKDSLGFFRDDLEEAYREAQDKADTDYMMYDDPHPNMYND
jgi:hypothetical protein